MRTVITHRFVEFIPEEIQEGVLYISLEYSTAVHKCFCGCGREVVTPLSPTDWSLALHDGSVSLTPSVGNWSFPCRSHYVVRRNRLQWCGDMPQSLINAGRARDKKLKEDYYARRTGVTLPKDDTNAKNTGILVPRGRQKGLISALLEWLKGSS